MNGYPSVEEAIRPFAVEAVAVFGYDEVARSKIANERGLPELAIADQYARSMAELGVIGVEQATAVQSQIGSALVEFQFRGFQAGQAPSPSRIQDALSDMAQGASALARGLALLRTTRQGVGLNNRRRAEALEKVHRRVIQVIAENALPQSLSAVTPDELDAAMPTASHLGFSDDWTHRWEHIAALLDQVADTANSTELKNPRRVQEEAFVNFVHRLGAVYTGTTNSPPRADARKSTQPDDWHSPFVRFLREVWPLTPEGSHGAAPPPDNQIARALVATPSF